MAEIKDGEMMDESLSPSGNRPIAAIGDEGKEEGKVWHRKLARALSAPHVLSSSSDVPPQQFQHSEEQWLSAKHQMKEVMGGQQAVMTEVSRVSNNQHQTETAAAQISKEITVVMGKLRTAQEALISRSQEREHGLVAQAESTLRLDRQTQERDGAIFDQTEEAFARTEETMRQIPRMVAAVAGPSVVDMHWDTNPSFTRRPRGEREREEPVPNTPMMTGGAEFQTERNVSATPLTSMAYVPISISDPPRSSR